MYREEDSLSGQLVKKCYTFLKRKTKDDGSLSDDEDENDSRLHFFNTSELCDAIQLLYENRDRRSDELILIVDYKQ